MKSKKAITLVSVIITVILLIIITGSTIGISLNRFKANNLKKMYNDIELLNNKVENYNLKYGGYPVLETYNSTLTFSTNENDNANYYIIDLSAIKDIVLNYGKDGFENPNNSDDVYIINEKSHIIYYVRGIEYTDGNIYHSVEQSNIQSSNSIGPTKPQINIVSKNDTSYEIEIVPGKDNIYDIEKTEYNIKSTDIANTVTQTGNIEISERTVIGDLSVDKAHEITATTTSNSGDTSQNTYKINEWIEKLDAGDYVNYESFIPDVTLTSESKLITDLTTYSGVSGSNCNTSNDLSQDTNVRWRILDVKNEKLRLISDASTSSKIYLSGVSGYNNGVYFLDEGCKQLYSSNKGTAQNLKIEDIEKHLEYDYTQYVDTETNPNLNYNGIKEYNLNINYPNIYKYEVGCKAVSSENNTGELGLSEQTSLITGTTSTTNRLVVTETLWSRNMEIADFTNPIYFELLIGNNSSCLSSRSVYPCDSFICFSFYNINSSNKKINNFLFFRTDRQIYSTAYFNLRPVVTLNKDVIIGEKVNDIWQINS